MKKLLILGGIALCFSSTVSAGCGQFKGPFKSVSYQHKARSSKPVRLMCPHEAIYYNSACSNAHFHSERSAAVCYAEGKTSSATWLTSELVSTNIDARKSLKDEHLIGKNCVYGDKGWQCQHWHAVRNIKVFPEKKQMSNDEDSGAYAIIDR